MERWQTLQQIKNINARLAEIQALEYALKDERKAAQRRRQALVEEMQTRYPGEGWTV